MKDNKLTIRINKPVSDIFAFVINPRNTPLWIDGIVKEETDFWPVKKGTKYRSQNQEGKWLEYVMAEFRENEMFVMVKDDNNYHVRYIFRPINKNSTEIEYFEWVDSGELDDSFTQEILEKLKRVLENLTGLNSPKITCTK